MTYATYISQLRAQSGDTKRRVHVDWTGDGTTTDFQMPKDTFPILDDTSTYTVKVATVSKTETTDYTLDKTTGVLHLISTPTNGQAISIDSIAVYLLDADWLTIINSTIGSLGDDFFKEFTDDTNFTTTANMLSLSLVASQPLCIAVYEFTERESSTDQWRQVSEKCNWRYDRENNIIYLGISTAFTTSSKPLKVRGLKTYTLGTAISDTIDVQTRFLTIIEYGCLARFYRWRYKDVIELVSKMTQESSRTPLQELIMLSDRFDRLYEQEKARLKPGKPARMIPPVKNGGGTP